jgi:hypothetical protein
MRLLKRLPKDFLSEGMVKGLHTILPYELFKVIFKDYVSV